MEENKDDEISIDTRKSKISSIPENSDDEISLDFGKIKNFFRRKKGEKKPEVHEEIENKNETQKDDDEINIDFSKIKKVFNKIFSEESNKEKKPEETEKHKIEAQDAKSTQASPITEIKSELKKQEVKEKPSNETHKESPVADKKKEIPQEKDDEIVIDFGNIAKKIKSMIGSKESNRKSVQSTEPQKKSDDDEININFSNKYINNQ